MPRLQPLPYQRYKLTLQYYGSRYAGWQQQVPTAATKNLRPTIQKIMEDKINNELIHRRDNRHSDSDEDNKAIGMFEDHKYVKCYGSSRTDAGVHAVAQTCHIDLCRVQKHTGAPIRKSDDKDEWEQYDPITLLKALNHLLHKENIRVVHVEAVHNRYHARHMAKSRRYLYRVHVNCASELSLESGRVWFLNGSGWLFRKEKNIAPVALDLEAMQIACKEFLGRHDFSCFAGKPNKNREPVSPVRTLDLFDMEVRKSADIDTIPPVEMFSGFKPYELRFHLSARSFLHNQVRLMVHAVIMVGLGKITVQDIQHMLQYEKHRTDATSRMAPPDGLYLMQVVEKQEVSGDPG